MRATFGHSAGRCAAPDPYLQAHFQRATALLSRQLSVNDREASEVLLNAETQVITPFGSARVLGHVGESDAPGYYVVIFDHLGGAKGYVHQRMVMSAMPDGIKDMLPPELQSQFASWVSPRQIASSIPKIQAACSTFLSDDATIVKLQKQLFQRRCVASLCLLPQIFRDTFKFTARRWRPAQNWVVRCDRGCPMCTASSRRTISSLLRVSRREAS